MGSNDKLRKSAEKKAFFMTLKVVDFFEAKADQWLTGLNKRDLTKRKQLIALDPPTALPS